MENENLEVEEQQFISLEEAEEVIELDGDGNIDQVSDEADSVDETAEEEFQEGSSISHHMASIEMQDASEEMAELKDDSIQGFFEHRQPVYSVDIRGEIAASGGGDDSVYIWNMKTGQTIEHIQDYRDSVSQVKFDPTGRYLAVASMEAVIRVYNASDYSILCSLECDSEIVVFDWHSTGRAIVAGCTDNTSWLFKIPSGRMSSIFWGHTQPVTCAMFSEDRIVTAAEDGKVIVWRPATADNLITYDSADARFAQSSILSLDLRYDNQLGVCGSADKTARLFHLHSHKILATFAEHSDVVETVCFSKNHPFVATGGIDGKICVWDINTSKLRSACLHQEGVVKVKFADEWNLISSISIDGTLRLWDSRSGECVKSFYGHQKPIMDFAFDIDSGLFATASEDGCCLVFEK